ncbi:MAG: glycosyltransferase family 39 protein, partial [Verrucomicrobiae bacterium]|nr:glycosyltransferase family 39 protein [Verrucomicrobiae bacterium]
MRRYVCETVLAVAVIFFVTAGIYSRSLHAPFVFDDSTHIERNPAIRIEKVDLGSLACAAFGSPDRNRPVTNLSFALNYRVGGYNVRGYHVTNMVIHALSGVLAFVFVRASFARLAVLSDVLLRTDARRIFELSIFSALIFVVHPVQTEAVTYVVQRATALSAMFSFLALLAYVQARSTTKVWLRWLLGCGAGLAWLLGLGSKETAAVLPLVTLLYDWYFFADLRRNWLRKGFGLLALYILFSAVIAYVYFHGRPVEWFAERYSRASFSMWQRLLTETRVVVFYLSLLFFPHPSRINLIHRFPTSVSMFDPPSTFLSFATIVGLVGLGVLCAGKERWVSFCIFWYLIWLALESSVLPLWIIFEHRLYLSALSFAALVPYLFHRWLRRPRWLLPVLLSTGVLLMSGASYVRNGVWTSAEGLWRDVISKNPDSPVAHGNLGDIMPVS